MYIILDVSVKTKTTYSGLLCDGSLDYGCRFIDHLTESTLRAVVYLDNLYRGTARLRQHVHISETLSVYLISVYKQINNKRNAIRSHLNSNNLTNYVVYQNINNISHVLTSPIYITVFISFIITK